MSIVGYASSAYENIKESARNYKTKALFSLISSAIAGFMSIGFDLANVHSNPVAKLKNNAPALTKKLIEYGWDCPYPDFVRQHIQDMERRPFDGIIMRLRGGYMPFVSEKWDLTKFAKDFENLKNISFKKFTDNFVLFWAMSSEGWDWFNESDWEAAEHNLRILARAARIGKCVGLCLDPEPYGPNPWLYAGTDRERKRSFEEYQERVRHCGQRFIKVIKAELPQPKILTFMGISWIGYLLRPMETSERTKMLMRDGFGLLPAFINGILDVDEDVVIIDGNEWAYYYTDRSQFFDAYHGIKQRAFWLVAPENWQRHRTQLQAGNALYIDQVFGLRKNTTVLGTFLEPEEKARFFEHHVYYALYTSDEYVWCYSEQMNWWTNQNIPVGAEEAIRSAKQKIELGEPLGFDLREIIEAANKRMPFKF